MFAVSLDVAFGKSKIEDENLVSCFIESNAEVIGFDIPMDEMTVVNVFDPRNHLVNKNQHCFQRKLAQSLIEEGLKGWAHQIHYQHVVVS
jgi:hypothetical protein